MRKIKVYRPPGDDAPLMGFLASLNGKLRDKLLFQIYRLQSLPQCDIKEPHFKHFVLEKYNQFYELREKNKILVRIIFTIHDGDIILLAPFVKRQSRDTMKALELSLRMLADIREDPESAVNFEFPKEETL